jgi:hypothetical protein
MGYRWHNGRLIDDEEYSAEINASYEVSSKIFGFMIPCLGLFLSGLFITDLKDAVLPIIGLITGGIIGYVFNAFFTKLGIILIWVIIIGGIVGAIALIIASYS